MVRFAPIYYLRSMILSTELVRRSEEKCELCSAQDNLSGYQVPPKSADKPENQIVVCSFCLGQINDPSTMKVNHWRCLNESMWNTEPAVQVMAFRLLTRLENEDWAQDLLGMIYMEDATREWAEDAGAAAVVHKDSNGHVLQNGDSVTLIQDLNVKGGGFTAKRGTAVRRIRLVQDNAEHIEGKVDGQQIVILTKYVKRN